MACEYCTPDSDADCPSFVDNSLNHFWIECVYEGKWVLHGNIGCVQILHCPMCGEKLGGDAS